MSVCRLYSLIGTLWDRYSKSNLFCYDKPQHHTGSELLCTRQYLDGKGK